jgi:cytosine/adenosine deaminase-related metal-dependent hydrolase
MGSNPFRHHLDKVMKKTTKKTKQTLVTPDQLAETYKSLFDAFLKKGFTTEQSFQLVLKVMSRS